MLLTYSANWKSSCGWCALSFVRQGSDIIRLRQLIDAKKPGTRIIAKIEMLEALNNLEEIIQLSDAVMVARGDLAIDFDGTDWSFLESPGFLLAVFVLALLSYMAERSGPNRPLMGP